MKLNSKHSVIYLLLFLSSFLAIKSPLIFAGTSDCREVTASLRLNDLTARLSSLRTNTRSQRIQTREALITGFLLLSPDPLVPHVFPSVSERVRSQWRGCKNEIQGSISTYLSRSLAVALFVELAFEDFESFITTHPEAASERADTLYFALLLAIAEKVNNRENRATYDRFIQNKKPVIAFLESLPSRTELRDLKTVITATGQVLGLIAMVEAGPRRVAYYEANPDNAHYPKDRSSNRPQLVVPPVIERGERERGILSNGWAGFLRSSSLFDQTTFRLWKTCRSKLDPAGGSFVK